MTTAIETRLPKQVQAAALKARQILDEQKAKRDTPPPNGVTVIENTEVDIPSLNTETRAGGKPTQAPAPSDDDERDLAHWKHRTLTLDGALKSTKEKQKLIVSDLNAQIATLQEQIRDLKDQLAASEPIKLEDYFTAEEVEALGEAEARIMARTLAATKRDAVKATRAEMQAAAAPKVASPSPATAADDDQPSGDDAFYQELDRLVPNWPQINKDKRWLVHCASTDEHTGFKIQQLLDKSLESLNAPAAAKLFRDFEKSLNVVEAPPPVVAPSARNAGGRENPPHQDPAPSLGKPAQGEITEHFKNRSLYFHKPEHPKHITDAEHKAFLARLQSAA